MDENEFEDYYFDIFEDMQTLDFHEEEIDGDWYN
jgi:hypothetical protein